MRDERLQKQKAAKNADCVDRIGSGGGWVGNFGGVFMIGLVIAVSLVFVTVMILIIAAGIVVFKRRRGGV